MDKVIVRFAKKKDLPSCVELALQRDAGIGKPPRRGLWRDLFIPLMDSNSLIIATMEKKVVGFCYFSPFLYSDNRNIYIQLIYIHQKYRKMGVGSALIEMVYDISKNRGANKLFSSCVYYNKISLAMHKKLGFEKCGFIKSIGKEDEREIFFSKKIQKPNP